MNSQSSVTAAHASIDAQSSFYTGAASIVANDALETNEFPSEFEIQRMSCPRCRRTFPFGFYCIGCGYVPPAQEN